MFVGKNERFVKEVLVGMVGEERFGKGKGKGELEEESGFGGMLANFKRKFLE